MSVRRSLQCRARPFADDPLPSDTPIRRSNRRYFWHRPRTATAPHTFRSTFVRHSPHPTEHLHRPRSAAPGLARRTILVAGARMLPLDARFDYGEGIAGLQLHDRCGPRAAVCHTTSSLYCFCAESLSPRRAPVLRFGKRFRRSWRAMMRLNRPPADRPPRC